MSFFRLHPFPGNAWPYLPNPQFSLVWSAYQELNQTQWLAPEEIERLQLMQVRQLVAHCRAHVPYYRRRLRDAGLKPNVVIQTMDEFRRIPILSRRDFQEHNADLVSEQLPDGTQKGGTISTSGSSGIPVTLQQTNLSQLWWSACYLRDLEWCEMNPRGKLATIRYFRTSGQEGRRARKGYFLNHWDRFMAQIIENGPSACMDIHRDPREQLEWLRKLNPEYLLSFPSNLDFLAGLIEESGKRLPDLRVIQAISETLTDEAKERIESAFGVPVRNTYSCAEAGYLASPCPEGHGLHVHAENVLLEVLDEDGSPCRPGEVGRVILTALHNFQTPFIRYQIMDQAAMTTGRCACGRGLPLLTRLLGKSHPLLQLPDGRPKNASRLVVLVRLVGGLHQFRIIQKAVDHYQVLIVPSKQWSDENVETVVKKVQEFCEHPVNVEVSTVNVLERLPGGKSVDIVTEVSS